jgi:hypothetical protein
MQWITMNIPIFAHRNNLPLREPLITSVVVRIEVSFESEQQGYFRY